MSTKEKADGIGRSRERRKHVIMSVYIRRNRQPIRVPPYRREVRKRVRGRLYAMRNVQEKIHQRTSLLLASRGIDMAPVDHHHDTCSRRKILGASPVDSLYDARRAIRVKMKVYNACLTLAHSVGVADACVRPQDGHSPRLS